MPVSHLHHTTVSISLSRFDDSHRSVSISTSLYFHYSDAINLLFQGDTYIIQVFSRLMEGQYMMVGRGTISSRGRGTVISRGRGTNSSRGRGKGGVGRTLELPSSSSSQMITSYQKNYDSKKMVKPTRETIINLEDADLEFTSDPFCLARKYFGKNCYFPHKGNKNREAYEQILQETRSAKFDHIFREGNACQSYLAYSKVKILKVLSVSEWGRNPNYSRYYVGLNGKFSYTYWDYVDAWINAFLYQNPQTKHTWFLRFEKEFSYQDLPNWFFLSWKKIGPLYCKTRPEFKGRTFDEHMTDRALLFYLAQFRIPWIWSWSLSVEKDCHGVPFLSRNYGFRWWQKFDTSEIIKEARNVCSKYKNDIKAKGKKRVHFDDDDEKDDNLKILKIIKFLQKHPHFTDEMLEMTHKVKGKKAKTTINI